jgi:hypothetical protein
MPFSENRTEEEEERERAMVGQEIAFDLYCK